LSDVRNEFKQFLLTFFEQYLPGYGQQLLNGLVVLWIAICAVVIHFILRTLIRRFLIKRQVSQSHINWESSESTVILFRRLSFIFQGGVIQIQARLWLEDSSSLLNLIEIMSNQWIILFALLALFSLLDIFQSLADRRSQDHQFPIKGLLQTIKLIALLLTLILALSLLMGKSPLLLLSGLGALSAVLLLVFKDPILGLVAGIQLSANNMLSVGDWLEMPKYGADGDVIEIALTTVKVQNWDMTITTIPTYALISDSFKNWRGMSESGGRRIKRSILINISSIKFLEEALLNKLRKAELLGAYLTEKLASVEQENLISSTDMSVLMNGRRLTNVGTFRKYLVSYLSKHPDIHQGMTLMVRQLEPTGNGLPIEIYAFTNTTSWAKYEAIQSDIMDHILAVVSEFDLRVHEAPTGYDLRQLIDGQIDH
jgi:miniconductance mechanosensitive channel